MKNYVKIPSIDYFGNPIEYEGFLVKLEAVTYRGTDEELRPIRYLAELLNKNDGTHISKIDVFDIKEIQIVEGWINVC